MEDIVYQEPCYCGEKAYLRKTEDERKIYYQCPTCGLSSFMYKEGCEDKALSSFQLACKIKVEEEEKRIKEAEREAHAKPDSYHE